MFTNRPPLDHIAGILPVPSALNVKYEGEARVVVKKDREEYIFTYPTAEVRGMPGSHLTMVLCGKSKLSCPQLKTSVEFTFHGEENVTGSVFNADHHLLATLHGSWRGLVLIKWRGEKSRKLLDMRNWSKPSRAKIVAKVEEQEDLESRRLWRRLSRSLAGKGGDPDTVKGQIEDQAKEKRNNEDGEHTPRFFTIEDDRVQFKYAL